VWSGGRDVLRGTPAAVWFVSAEPLLGPLPGLDLTGIDWLIAGGESGPGARPVAVGWIRDLRDRCAVAGTAFFFKQWGGRARRPAAGSWTAGRGTSIPLPAGSRQRDAVRSTETRGAGPRHLRRRREILSWSAALRWA
jgi:protein gp37